MESYLSGLNWEKELSLILPDPGFPQAPLLRCSLTVWERLCFCCRLFAFSKTSLVNVHYLHLQSLACDF
jgi:hypothetical protein